MPAPEHYSTAATHAEIVDTASRMSDQFTVDEQGKPSEVAYEVPAGTVPDQPKDE